MNAPRLLPVATLSASAVLIAALFAYDAAFFSYWTPAFTLDLFATLGALALVAGVLRVLISRYAVMLLVAVNGFLWGRYWIFR